jgi:hypothetical protein
MRRRLGGFGVSVLMAMAIGGLTAPPSFATDYFVKYLNQIESDHTCVAPVPTGPRHGSAVFRRTQLSMFVTIHLRNASPNTSHRARLVFKKTSIDCGEVAKSFTTDGSGNATVQLGPVPRKGKQAFWAEDSGVPFEAYSTRGVPAFGF